MTEHDAEIKWCPLRRRIVWVDESGNPTDATATNDDATCITSACMMWRARSNRDVGYDRNPDDIHDYYCGIAGKKGVL